jgi:hypothetical protein
MILLAESRPGRAGGGAFSGHYFGFRRQKAWFLPAALGEDGFCSLE